MKNRHIHMLAIAGAIMLSPAFAGAECYADYKAKKDAPLQLHYGVISLPDDVCANNADAENLIESRISVGGWALLNVISVFGPDGLTQRQESAGKYYLLY